MSEAVTAGMERRDEIRGGRAGRVGYAGFSKERECSGKPLKDFKNGVTGTRLHV